MAKILIHYGRALAMHGILPFQSSNRLTGNKEEILEFDKNKIANANFFSFLVAFTNFSCTPV